ncbi:unnamed protein product [Ceutorhynchus assimilis]|uniref:Uncharacterized protein n=1 Tax=Ceutorhynchus assimilis TaxID=467358 RepID=A0A9N9MGJ5_9CUCU|nr:unnamed protein product [Ceutorhynchus assimilis]
MLSRIALEQAQPNKILAYHKVCGTSYYGKCSNEQSKAKETTWSAKRNIHQAAQFLDELHVAAGLQNDYFGHSIINLSNQIQQNLKSKIKCVIMDKKTYFMSQEMNINEINDAEIREIIFEQEAADFAMKYRANILKVKSTPLPEYLDSTALKRGEWETPRWGHTKPSKHILLGLTMKSLTGSEKVINILSKLGYCVSYSTLVELETSVAYSCVASKKLCPSSIYPTNILPFGVAWDNFDRFVETSGKGTAGKDTLHDTVGIMYQSIPTRMELELINSTSFIDKRSSNFLPSIRNAQDRRKRSFELQGSDDFHHAKQSRPTFWSSSVVSTTSVPQNLKAIKQINFCWLLSQKLQVPNTPMWAGYISRILKDESPMQKIEYLLQINSSPTNPDVVKETMLRSLQIASECGKEYYNVTYDLAMAKIALRIQSAEPQFSSLFIHFGSFHTMMSYHKAVGKFMDGSGLVNMLIDSGIMANGSAYTFLKGKHFNRCRKFHPLLSLALQILHFERFLVDKQFPEVEIEKLKMHIVEFNTINTVNPRITSVIANMVFDEYEKFKEDTLKGKHDFELFKYMLPKLTNLFFTMNHQNYSRYLTLYADKLNKIEETHPGLLNDCKECLLGIRRTLNPFCRIPIDLSLEQTVNADAASKASGVINLTDSFSARQRWSITHAVRTHATTMMTELCGMKKGDDTVKDLKKSTIQHWRKKLVTLLDFMQNCTNPFSKNLEKSHLYNVSSGQTVSDEIYEFLSSVESSGEQQRNKFISECLKKPERFDQPISKNKIINFNFGNKKKVKIAGQVKEIKIQRDVFGRLLCASLEKNIDLEKALSYPLVPVSFSFCHLEGSICKTQKSVIINYLKTAQSEHIEVPEADIHIIDGFYLLHRLKNVPDTYGKISSLILNIISKNRKEAHIVFDLFRTPSIKDYEHDKRGEEEIYFDIKRENKRRVEFKDWASDGHVLACVGKKIMLNYDRCYSYKVSNNKMLREIDYDFTCFHEEADTKIVFHVCQLHKNYRVQVHCTDSDIPVIMLTNFKFRRGNTEIIINLSTKHDENGSTNMSDQEDDDESDCCFSENDENDDNDEMSDESDTE